MNFLFGKKKEDGSAGPSRSQIAALNSDNWDDEIHEQVAELTNVEQSSQKPKEIITLPTDYKLNDMLERMFDLEGSDLHLSVGAPPAMRIHGDLTYTQAPPLTVEKAEQILKPILGADKYALYLSTGNMDFSFEIPNVSRFRVNYFRQMRGMAAVFRVIPKTIPTLEQLKLPLIFKQLCDAHQGLVLVTGPTGSGKSTTLASMINYINESYPVHIITVEDPIEFFHTSKKALLNHREIGEHAVSFSDGIRAAMREDPDIILVGEMRDLDTIYNAIKAAETGHLVFATLHTNSAAKSIDRIIDVFPGKQQPQIRAMLAESIKAVIAQLLLKKLGGGGRVAAHEILVSGPGFPAMVREGKTSQINNYIMTNRELGMQSMDACLIELLRQKRISIDTAKEVLTDPTFFKNQGFPVDMG